MEPVVLVALGAVLAGVAVLALRWRVRRAGRGTGPSPGSRTIAGALEATRRGLGDRLRGALGGGHPERTRALTAIEEALVGADVGVRTAEAVVERIGGRVPADAVPGVLLASLRDGVAEMLAGAPAPAVTARPWVVLVVGVNGTGKTTTIGKLALWHRQAGRRVLVVAGDTFRAAAAEQLAVWADRASVDIVRQHAGVDPAAVVHDGVRAAIARGADVVLVDTAGRLHTHGGLMDELRKVRRIVAREIDGAPHETLLVLDATTGQNAIAQARVFLDAVQVTGVVLTKLDGTARGGVAVAIVHELGLPLQWVGTGEGAEDLQPFDATAFAAALVDPAALG